MLESSPVACFIDTNVWLYAFIESQDGDKARIAKELIADSIPTISSQVINELCVNLLKKTAISEEEVEAVIRSFYQRYAVLGLDREILVQASRLRGHYSFSFWDSVIVSSALRSGVAIIYSEDMQAGLVVENRLEIRNPFSAST